MAAVDLSKTAPGPGAGPGRHAEPPQQAAGRAYAASVERITAVVQKPRTFYIPDSTMTGTTLGSPAFTLDGNILGVNVMRIVGGGDEAGRNMREGITAIFLPAEDILKAAKQAPEAKGDTKPEETKAPVESKADADVKTEKK